MNGLFSPVFFDIVTGSMAALAVVVFICLQRIDAGYGMMYTKKWGPTVGNRLGWFIMEFPALACMAVIWSLGPQRGSAAPCVMGALFCIHYIQRTFIFPFLIRGKGRMPWAIIFMGMTFNVINAYMIGGWLFWVASPDRYPANWLLSPLFFLGTAIFLIGMGINLHSDHVIRTLRSPGDTAHYIPRKGFYRFVTGANYFGEFTEWVGFAILTWSVPGLVFAMWTFANLAPRARTLHKRYCEEFGEDYQSLGRKFIIPFVY